MKKYLWLPILILTVLLGGCDFILPEEENSSMPFLPQEEKVENIPVYPELSPQKIENLKQNQKPLSWSIWPRLYSHFSAPA